MADILFISPIPTHPTNHGNRARTLALANALIELGHHVHYLYAVREGCTLNAEEEMRRHFHSVHIVEPDEIPALAPAGDYHKLDDWWLPETGDIIDHIMRHYPIDLVMVNYVWFSKALEHIPTSIPSLIDTHDIFADRHQSLKKLGLKPNFFYTSRAEEDKGFARASHLLAIQDHEAKAIRKRGFNNCTVVGHMIKPDFDTAIPVDDSETTQSLKLDGQTPETADSGTRLTVGYFGSDNQLNQLAATELAKAIGALDPSRELNWLLAGSICSHFPAEKWPGEKMSYIENPDVFYARADIVVNPHIGGTGLKIKSVEALSKGKPLFATTEAMLGLQSDLASHKHETTDSLVVDVIKTAKNIGLLRQHQLECQRVFMRYTNTQFESLNAIVLHLTGAPGGQS